MDHPKSKKVIRWLSTSLYYRVRVLANKSGAYLNTSLNMCKSKLLFKENNDNKPTGPAAVAAVAAALAATEVGFMPLRTSRVSLGCYWG